MKMKAKSMKTIMHVKFRNSLNYALIFLTLTTLVLIYGCDTFEEDNLSPEKSVDISSGEVFVLPNSSSVIDFTQIVSARQSVSVTITDQPTKGDFQNIEGNLFKYKPNKDFMNGTDRIGFNVLSTANEPISQGVINITVTQDTSEFPCAIFAVQDGAETMKDTPVTVNILSNDILCGIDSMDLEVSIIMDPANGEATLSERQLNYFPNSGFTGLDSVLYKINPVSEPDSSSVALVYINVTDVPDSCVLTAVDDRFNFMIPDNSPVTVNVLINDILCDADSTQIGFVTILEPTHFGDVAVVENNQVRYWPNPDKGAYADSLTYRICHNDVCDEAKAVFNFEPPVACSTIAFDDFYNLSDTTQQTTYWFNILENDQYCNLSNVNIEIVEHGKAGESGVSDKQILYSQFNSQAASDSLTYRMCEEIDGELVCDEAKVRITL